MSEAVPTSAPADPREEPVTPDDHFELYFDPATVKHLGLQMYSTLPPVIGELISNAWDADATLVTVSIPDVIFDEETTIVVEDNGTGMSDAEVQDLYLIVGRDRRRDHGQLTPIRNRRVMGRKGIGKFSAFGVAKVIEVETVKDGEATRFELIYDDLLRFAEDPENRHKRRPFVFPRLEPTGTLSRGTRVTLRGIQRYRTRRPSVQQFRRAIARRFSVLGDDFRVVVNGDPITLQERDLTRLLDESPDGRKYLWAIDEEIVEGSGWRVTGWIGALPQTAGGAAIDDPGIAILARGKLVQEPFYFEAVAGQQYALAYLVGELHADFVDEKDDTIATSRNSLVWETEANKALLEWGRKRVDKISREWAERRSSDRLSELETDPIYEEFRQRAADIGETRTAKVVDRLIRKVVADNVVGDDVSTRAAVQLCLDFMEFDAFQELAEDLQHVEDLDVARLMELFQEWELLEAKEMLRVTRGRIETIRRLQDLIAGNALEVPTLHRFLAEFPWVLDPRWSLIADERTLSRVLRDRFPDSHLPEDQRRIDFLCVRENTQLVVVEIKRPGHRAGHDDLVQIEQYVHFVRANARQTTDPDLRLHDVVGYLLVGDLVADPLVAEKRASLEETRIFVRRYEDLLALVVRDHGEFLSRYEALQRRERQRTLD